LAEIGSTANSSDR